MPLPVFDIIAGAVRDLWDNRRDFAAFAFLPVLGVSIVGTLMSAFIGDVSIFIDDPAKVPPGTVTRMLVGTLVNWLASFVLYTMFAVAWHRRILVGAEPTVGAALRWRQRHWRYLGRLVALFVNLMVLLFLSLILLLAIVPVEPLVTAVLVVMGLIYARMSLVLPAAAVDMPMTFGQAVKLTAGNSWRMLLAVVALPLAVTLFGGLVVLQLATPLADIIGSSLTARFLVTLVAQAVDYIGFAAGITALSLTYRHLTASP